MGSTADHQHDFEEFRVPPKQWEKHPENYPVNYPDPIKPNYYRRTIKGVEIDVIDIIQAFGINSFLLGSALKYIIRAGQKEGNSKEQDLGKAKENIERELEGTK